MHIVFVKYEKYLRFVGENVTGSEPLNGRKYGELINEIISHFKPLSWEVIEG